MSDCEYALEQARSRARITNAIFISENVTDLNVLWRGSDKRSLYFYIMVRVASDLHVMPVSVGDNFLQHFAVDIRKALDVKAADANRILSQFFQKLLLFLRARLNIKRQVLFSRRESDRRPIKLAAVRIFDHRLPEPDYRRPPHLRLFARDSRKHLEDAKAVLTTSLVFHGV